MDATYSANLLNVDNYQLATNNYISILEKTNSQLNMWTNPYGLMIGILTILIALIAMGVSIVLWKNSEEQKKRTEKFFSEQEKNAEKLRKEREIEVKLIKKNLNKLIEEYQNKLLTADKDNKKKIEDAINSLKKEEAVIGTYTFPSNLTSSYQSAPNYINIFPTETEKELVCSKCGNKFKFLSKIDNPLISPLIGVFNTGPKIAHCSFCGATNIVQ